MEGHKIDLFGGYHRYMTLKRIYLVWCLWFIMGKKSTVNFVLKVFMSLKRIIEEVFDFICNSIVHRRK